MTRLNKDCFILIFNELQTDKKSLHSCLLVSKEWCHLVIPILWKRCLWFYDDETIKKLSNTILACLSPSSKQILFDNDIKLPSNILVVMPLFNYISFCKFLEAEIIDKITRIVLEEKEWEYNKRNLLEQEIYKLFVSQCINIKELVWETSQPLSLFSGASTCFPQLYSLSINVDLVSSNTIYKMAQICKDLNILIIHNCSQNNPGLISLIDVQRNLKSMSIYSYIKKEACGELSKALERKGNMITDLYLGSINIVSPLFLMSLVNLNLYNSFEYEDIGKEIKEYIAASEFPNLQFLDVHDLWCFKELAMLIEKTKGHISELYIYIFNKDAENTESLIKAIANNCPKIKFLSTYLEPKDFIYVKLLLLNCKDLVYIKFNNLKNTNDTMIGDELLDILTKVSPTYLINLSISGDWRYSIDALKRFFESCRKRTLNYFDINSNNKYYITEGHRMVIRQYVSEEVIINSNCA